ncbi:MAG: substrate-binding domain-containing protein, partial [Sandaracinaceae bacterium]|nr:substrate-binding domain-containing protein [Sandaracinaceae bacterium]
MSFLYPHFSPAFRWGLVVFVLGGVVVWSSVHCLESSPLPPHLRSPPKGAWERVARRAKNALGDGLHLAGSGSNLVITRALAAAFREAYPNAHLVVHESIGSTGGVRAVLDGVITLGLIARPLRPHEMHPRLRVFPYARVPIAIIAHPDVRTPFITQDEMIATLQGEAKPWPDGTPRIWLLRERGDAGTEVLIRHIKGLREAMEEALSAKRFRVVYHDHELIRAVLGLRGSLGISDLP